MTLLGLTSVGAPATDPGPPVAPVTSADLLIRRAPGDAWLGDGIYEPDGAGQVLEVSTTVGESEAFHLRVDNDGEATDTFRLAGVASERYFAVRYFSGSADITGQVRNGTFRIRDLEPGEHRVFGLTVAVAPDTPAGRQLTRWVTATSEGLGHADRVGLVVNRGAPVRLRDVGPLLGLSRDTSSWDLVVGPIDRDDVPDLVVSYHGRIEIFLNRLPGLERVFGTSPSNDTHGCAIGDLDLDGDGDVYCTRGARNGTIEKVNRLWVQADDGTFANHAEAQGVTDPFGRGRHTTFIDFDHQGGLDLFIGNENPRPDGRSLNRLFLGGSPFVEYDAGLSGDEGALCAQAFDQNGDGWEDLLLCGGTGRATAGRPDLSLQRLYLYRNQPGPAGRRLVNVAPGLGLSNRSVASAQLAHLNGDPWTDLVVVQRNRLSVRPGRANGGFGPVVYQRQLAAGVWITAGNVDGRADRDLFVVQECVGSNVADLLLVDRGPGWGYREVRVPTADAGCGDIAAMLDVDGDGWDDVIVGNGRWGSRGPMQVFTAGPWRG